MKINDYFERLLPEEKKLPPETHVRIMNKALSELPKEKTRRFRPVRMGLLAAAITVLLCATVAGASFVDWNRNFREFFNLKSEDVQGYVEYAQSESETSFQPVNCVTGIRLIDFRFTYGPISREEAEKLDFRDGFQEEIMQLRETKLGITGDATLESYDPESGYVLMMASIYYEGAVPESLCFEISKKEFQTGENREVLGTMEIIPEISEIKSAALDLPIEMEDGSVGILLGLRVDAGSYCWVIDVPGFDEMVEQCGGDFDTAIRDRDFNVYCTDISNRALELYERGAELNYADGTTRDIGGGLGPLWDGEHFCEWGGGGVYDLDNLVSVTICGVEYPFE